MAAAVSVDADDEGDDAVRAVGADKDWPGSGRTRVWFCSYDGFLPHRQCAVQPFDDGYGDGAGADWVQSVAYRRHYLDHEGGADEVGG